MKWAAYGTELELAVLGLGNGLAIYVFEKLVDGSFRSGETLVDGDFAPYSPFPYGDVKGRIA